LLVAHVVLRIQKHHNNGLYYRSKQINNDQAYNESSSDYTAQYNEFAPAIYTAAALESERNDWQYSQQQQQQQQQRPTVSDLLLGFGNLNMEPAAARSDLTLQQQ
jgi:hypothetical protein